LRLDRAPLIIASPRHTRRQRNPVTVSAHAFSAIWLLRQSKATKSHARGGGRNCQAAGTELVLLAYLMARAGRLLIGRN